MSDKQPESIKGGSLCILNSVRQSQYAYRKYQPDLLLHSHFTDADRRRNLSRVMKSFGKEGKGVENGETVVSALMAQAVLDISFLHLYESVCSPESTLQRIGRVDRWGTFWHKLPTICLFRHRFDRHAIQTIYDNKLHQAWWNFLRGKHPDGEEAVVDLATLYNYYNEFYEVYADQIRDVMCRRYSDGTEGLASLGPVRWPIPQEAEDQDDGPQYIRSWRGLRNPTGTYYYTVRTMRGHWLGPDEVIDDLWLPSRIEKTAYQDTIRNDRAVKKVMKALSEEDYPEYARLAKRTTPISEQEWLRLARSTGTPFLDMVRRYSPAEGVFDPADYDNSKK